MKQQIAIALSLVLILASCGKAEENETNAPENTSEAAANTASWEVVPAETLSGSAVIEIQNAHPLAGETLNFEVEMVEITKAEWNEQETVVENGDSVQVHYTGTLNDGEEFDSSRGKDTLGFTVGAGQMIPGFDAGVVWMELGGTKDLVLDPEDAYGPTTFEQTIELSRLQEFANAGFDIAVWSTLPVQWGEITIKSIEK